MRPSLWLLPFVAVLLPGAPANADMLSAPEPFVERYTEHVPVGGRSLAGVVATPDATSPSGVGLIGGRVTLPGFVTGPVCVRALTEDGRYEATNTYTPAQPGPARHALAWSARYRRQLADVALREVAILARPGACGDRTAAVVPAGLEAGGPFLQILVNTRGAVTSAVLRDRAAGRTVTRAACQRLDAGTRVAFDARCVLGPLPASPALELRIEQEGKDGLSMEVVETVTLSLGASAP